MEIAEGDDSMTFDGLFSGEELWLGPDADPGWVLPYLVVLHWVELDPQPKGLDPLEGPEVNWVVDEAPPALEDSFGWHDGWPAFSVALQKIGEVLTRGSGSEKNLMATEQRVARDKRMNVISNHYRVVWNGDEIEGI